MMRTFFVLLLLAVISANAYKAIYEEESDPQLQNKEDAFETEISEENVKTIHDPVPRPKGEYTLRRIRRWWKKVRERVKRLLRYNREKAINYFKRVPEKFRICCTIGPCAGKWFCTIFDRERDELESFDEDQELTDEQKNVLNNLTEDEVEDILRFDDMQ